MYISLAFGLSFNNAVQRNNCFIITKPLIVLSRAMAQVKFSCLLIVWLTFKINLLNLSAKAFSMIPKFKGVMNKVLLDCEL